MNKLILSLCSCSGSIMAISLATNTIGSTDPITTIPYPEVMNLARVPIFDANGIVPQPNVANHRLPSKFSPTQSIARAKPAPINVDLVSQTVRVARINQSNRDCLGCRNLTPSMMVLGYSSDRSYSSYPQPIMY